MNKKIIAMLFLLALLVPIPRHYKDGGTVEYHAILYSVTNYHSIVFDSYEKAYDTGIEIKILGITVYENTTFDEKS